MSIDFDNKDSRQNYLNEKLDNLLSESNKIAKEIGIKIKNKSKN